MPHFINTKKLQRIWFTANPNVFLGLENELAMIRLVEKNPGAKITLVYSLKCLNHENKSKMSQINLAFFAKRHGIHLIDFDSLIDVKDEKIHPFDRELFSMAHEEIDAVLSKKGGNLAVASDYARLIVPLIHNGGIYSDFDTEINFSTLPELYSVNTPVVFPTSGKVKDLVFNNDFLAFSVNPKAPNELSEEALQRLRLLQERLINNRKHFNQDILLCDIFGEDMSLPQMPQMLIKLFFKHQKDTSFTAFAKYMENSSIEKYYALQLHFLGLPPYAYRDLNDLLEDSGKILYDILLEEPKPPVESVNFTEIALRQFNISKNELLALSTVNTSGSRNYVCFYNDVKEKGKGKNAQQSRMLTMYKKANACGLSSNKLHKYVFDQMSKPCEKRTYTQILTGKVAYPMIGETNDASWTPIGASKKEQREQCIKKAGRQFLRNFNKRKAAGKLQKQDLTKKFQTLELMPKEEKKDSFAYDKLGEKSK